MQPAYGARCRCAMVGGAPPAPARFLTSQVIDQVVSAGEECLPDTNHDQRRVSWMQRRTWWIDTLPFGMRPIRSGGVRRSLLYGRPRGSITWPRGRFAATRPSKPGSPDRMRKTFETPAT